jgi:peptide/nickel transport system ATP-binding protein
MSNASDTPLIAVEGLGISLNTSRGRAQAVREVSFALKRGETLGLVGESGCGKSITALALMGLLPDSAIVSGSIRLDGGELVGLSDSDYCRLRGNRISMIFQEPMTALNPMHTIGRQVAEPLRRHNNLSAAEARKQAIALLDRVADEPTTALDVTIQRQILDLIADLVEERGMAMILISHDLGVIAENVQRMMVMYGGTVVESGTTEQVFSRMSHPYTQGLFRARPRLGARKGTRLTTIAGTVPELAHLPDGCTFADRCPIVIERCRTALPAALDVGGDHRVRCIRTDVSMAGAVTEAGA